PSGLESRYLLSGLAQCTCKGGIIVDTRGRQKWYACATHRHRGTCHVDKFWRMEVVDQAILDEVRKLLSPARVEQIVTPALAKLKARPATTDEQKAPVRKELQEVEAEIQNLTQAVALGRRPVPELVALLQTRDRRRTELQGQLAALEGHGEARLDIAGPELRRRLGEWVGFLGRNQAP